MTNSYFEFKKFKLFHDRCGMKIGTDGVLLGAWMSVCDAQHILDIGTGSGLIALMAAQRTETAQITGVDIDQDAIGQARENAERTEWNRRIHFICDDIRKYQKNSSDRFNHIVCNPPFYQDALCSPDIKRNNARNASVLPFGDLILATDRLLENGGYFSVVLPVAFADNFIQICWETGLNLNRKTYVITKIGKQPKRVLLEFFKGRPQNYPTADRLILQDESGKPTEEYHQLTEMFYLK